VTLVERVLLIATGVLATLACVGWLANAPRVGPAERTAVARVVDVAVPPAESIDAAARVVAQTDPFRLERRPTAVRYRPDLEGVAPPAKPPKPELVLDGLVGPAAILDGIPGHSATIVHVGDTVGGLRIRRIGRDTAIVSGADTTWRLTLRHAWQ
jgi:hypothetical protein